MRGFWLILAALLVIGAGAALYLGSNHVDDDVLTIAERVSNPYNRTAIDSAASLVQDGDIIVRTGNDMTSLMFCRANLKDPTYSHCGIVAIEHGYPFVYHCIGGEDNPAEVLRRDSLQFWLSPAHNKGFGIMRFPLSPAQKDTLLGMAQYYYRLHTRFDLAFDITDDSKLYCAELVYRTLNTAMGDSNFVRPTHHLGYTYVAVDDITTAGGKWIWQIRYK